MRAVLVAVIVSSLACGAKTNSSTDSGMMKFGGVDSGVVDAGTPDAGSTDAGPPDSGMEVTDAGPVDAGPFDAGPVATLLDLFEISGSVSNTNVQILAPYVSVIQGTPLAHAYDDRTGIYGCYADHYDTSTNPPPKDANAGPITITGYKGGRFVGALSSDAPTEIQCEIENGNYTCGYGAITNGDIGKVAGEQAYSSGTNPLGTSPISFTDGVNTVLGTFSVSQVDFQTTTVPNLSGLTYRANNSTVVEYTCSSGSCGSGLIIITLAATQNSSSNLTGSSPTFGAVSCAVQGGSSYTIPAAAITAMLDGDSALRSVVTSVVYAVAATVNDRDSNGNLIGVLVGRGAFGVSSL